MQVVSQETANIIETLARAAFSLDQVTNADDSVKAVLDQIDKLVKPPVQKDQASE